MCICVCVCVCWIMNAFFLLLWLLLLLRDVFESLICWLDLCLSSLLIAFISMCFSSLWKTHFLQARQLLDKSSTDSYLSSPLDFLSRQKLVQFRSIELFGIHLDSFSTASRQLLDPSRYFCHRQILNNNSMDSFLSRFSAWQISIAPRSIELCFSIYS